jgi:hypothetical protein
MQSFPINNETMAFDLENTKKTAKSALRKTLWYSLVIGLLTLTAYYFYRTWVYSEGTRTGVLIKVSKKGNVLKTYEGQLHLGGSSMMTDKSVWDFSVKNEQVYNDIQALEGKTVKCHYKELIDPFPWQGDTKYLVYQVEELK